MSKSGAKIEHATKADLDFVLAHMRQADVDEVYATVGTGPVHALAGVEKQEDCYIGKWDEEPVAVMGVVPRSLITGGGTIWMLGTDGINRHKIAFLKHGRRWVESMLQKYGELSNYVDARNTVSINWLKWLGFKIEDPQPYGVKQLPFHPFHMGET